MNEQQPTTKLCPKCGSECLVLLRSQNLKICADCGTEIPWHLDKGQKPLLTNGRAKP